MNNELQYIAAASCVHQYQSVDEQPTNQPTNPLDPASVSTANCRKTPPMMTTVVFVRSIVCVCVRVRACVHRSRQHHHAFSFTILVVALSCQAVVCHSPLAS